MVIDGQRNDWSDKLFFSLAPKEQFFPEKEEVYDSATIEEMIKHLETMDSLAARELILKFQNQL